MKFLSKILAYGNKQIGLKALELMLIIGGVAGAFFYGSVVDPLQRSDYLVSYVLFLTFSFLAYIIALKGPYIEAKISVKLILLGITATSVGSFVGLMINTSFVKLILLNLRPSTMGDALNIFMGALALLFILLFTIYGSYFRDE